MSRESIHQTMRKILSRLNRSKLFLLFLLVLIVPPLIVLAIPENRTNLSGKEFLQTFTLGFQMVYWLVESVIEGLLNLLRVSTTYFFSEWRYALFLAGIYFTLIYSDVRKNRREKERQIDEWNAYQLSESLEVETEEEFSKNNLTEMEPDKISTDLNSLTELELLDKKTALKNLISMAEDEIDDIWYELEARESNEKWYRENGLDTAIAKNDEDR
jgi:hypothetical protein